MKITLTNQQSYYLFWVIWTVTLSSLMVIALRESGYRVNFTNSAPKGLYKITTHRPVRGSFVQFCLPDEFTKMAKERNYISSGSCPNGLQPLLKSLAGIPGDILLQTKDGIAINGQIAPHSVPKATDSRSREMITAVLPPMIPEDMALVLSPVHDGSFDSRYFGLIEFATLTTVTSIVTF